MYDLPKETGEDGIKKKRYQMRILMGKLVFSVIPNTLQVMWYNGFTKNSRNTLNYVREGTLIDSLHPTQSNCILPNGLAHYFIIPVPDPPVFNALVPSDSFPADLVAAAPVTAGTRGVGSY